MFLFSHGFHMGFPRKRTRYWRLDPIVEKNVPNELAIRDLSLTFFSLTFIIFAFQNILF